MLMRHSDAQDIFEFLTILRSLVTGPNGMVHMYKPFSLMENVLASMIRGKIWHGCRVNKGGNSCTVGLVRKTARTSWCLADF